MFNFCVQLFECIVMFWQQMWFEYQYVKSLIYKFSKNEIPLKRLPLPKIIGFWKFSWFHHCNHFTKGMNWKLVVIDDSQGCNFAHIRLTTQVSWRDRKPAFLHDKSIICILATVVVSWNTSNEFQESFTQCYGQLFLTLF